MYRTLRNMENNSPDAKADADAAARAIIEASRQLTASNTARPPGDKVDLSRAGVSESDYAQLLRSFELLPAKVIDEIVAPLLRAALEPHGFEAITPRKWVKSSSPPIRPIFELSAIGRGPSKLSPCWGFSLDYVPHVSGGSVRWHRTPKTARFDICNAAIDAPSELPGGSDILLVHGPAVVRFGAADLIPRAVARALEFWNLAASEADLPAVFEYLKRRPTERFGFYNYVQHPLAYAFTLARLGRRADAKRELKRFLDFPIRTEFVQPRLLNLLQSASQS